jgi:hypothetical protein
MNTHRWNGFVVCLAVLLLTACSSPEPVVENDPNVIAEPPQAASEPVAPPALPEQWIAGELQAVDLNARTFTIREAEGTDQTLHFSESTEIVGAPDAQGLSGQQGAQVTAYYMDAGDTKMAARVEIIPR